MLSAGETYFNKMNYTQQYEFFKNMTECELERALPSDGSVVTDAMRYSLLGGGKRVRAVLTLAVAWALGKHSADSLYAAAAIEMVHAYSLIHDDLPCMDNDDMRRGKPSCHKAFSEDIALLAGDGLLTKAFEELCKIKDDYSLGACVRELSDAAGHKGMILGQELDITLTEDMRDISVLDNINVNKTGKLIKAAVLAGYNCSGIVDSEIYNALSSFAEKVGKAFQIIDDILDVTSSSEDLGKTVGSDLKNEKATYVTLLGLDASYEAAEELTENAVYELENIHGDFGFLTEMAYTILNRKK